MRRRYGAPDIPPVVTVITPAILGREPLLLECERSVTAQTFEMWEHLILLDDEGAGNSVTVNRLVAEAKGEWLLPLADDDLLLPGCMSILLLHAADADIVYAPPLVNGNEDRWWFYQAPPLIPSFALIRAELWNELGGYDETLAHEEDRRMWTKALDAGARFVRVDEPCWVYRQHSSNKSFNKVAA